MDERQHLPIVGRVKDVIISGGINIYVAELERTIGTLDGVEDVAVIGVPVEKYGETPAAFVVGSWTFSEDEIFSHCREQFASYKTPKHVTIVEGPLPRTPLGKLTKPQIRDLYGKSAITGAI